MIDLCDFKKVTPWQSAVDSPSEDELLLLPRPEDATASNLEFIWARIRFKFSLVFSN
jgi:hypothetical protein